MELTFPTMELAAQTDLVCEIMEDPKPQWAQTYLFKGPLEAFEAFALFIKKSDLHASVMRVHLLEHEVFMIVTLGKGENTKSFARRSTERLKNYPGGDKLEWIRPLTMRYACLFGWAQRVHLKGGGSKLVLVPVTEKEGQRVFQHPLRPLPLYVLSPPKPSDAEKLAWILQEVPGDADICVFCKKFLELFGANFTTKTAQKATALRLFGIHTKRQLEKGIDLEADELELFELAWDAKARARCRLCKGEVEEVQAAYFHARAPECKRPDCTIIQAHCRACETESEEAAGWHTCKPCQREPLPTPTGTDSALLRCLKRSHEMRRIHNNVWQTEIGEAAAKKRKRT